MKPKEGYPKLNLVPELLKEKERSQRYLARKLGISANAVNAICQQKAQPLDRLFQIAKVLEVSITVVINVDFNPDKPH
jgi:transcriptional regulator with XRE-family HTH domain